MRRRDQALVAVLLALALNSVYLGARADATLFYFANVALHPVLGIAAAAGLGLLARRGWRWLHPAWRAAAVLFALGSALGASLLATGATRPFRPLLYAHVALVAAAALVALGAGLRAWLAPAGAGMRAAAAVAALLAAASGALRLAADRNPPQHRIENTRLAPASMDGEGQGPGGPFFPSSAETNTGGAVPSNFFMKSAECARCHKDIYDQWNSSAHHFASFNNQWYRKSIEYMQDVVGTRPSRWCAGCHDHALLFAGKFDRPVREQIDSPEAQAGLACTSCHSIVHVKSTTGQGDFTIEYPPLHDLATSENAALRAGHDYLLRLDPGPHSRTFLKSFHTDQTPEFCASCHKVHLDVPVNSYRWVRGFNDYDNWQASGVSGEGARSFYYPPRPQKCVDCHMPLVPSKDPAARDGRVHSHRFPAANTALPYVNQDREQLELTQAFLKDAVTVDVFALVPGEPEEPAPLARRRAAEAAPEAPPLARRRAAEAAPTLSSTFAQGEESMAFGAQAAVLRPAREAVAPIDRVDAAVRRGDSAPIDVVVRTRRVGHFFPGGTVDAFDVWVELEVTDSRGRKIFHSGLVEDGGRGPVEPGAHFYRSLMLDEHGNPINKRNAWAARSVAYVRLIPPGAADTVHFRLRVPEDCGERLTLKARLNYRKFAWWNTQWAYAGVRDPGQGPYSIGPGHDDGRWSFTGDTSKVSGKVKQIPEIPITVVSEASATIRVLPKGAPAPQVEPLLEPRVRERWNDYGIGLLLQGDLKGAEAAFLKVTRMEPGYADGWVNVARARLTQGSLAGAEEVLRKALEIAPDLAKTHFFLGTVLKQSGRYDEALPHLRRAAGLYPRDRVVRNQVGRLLFLKRQYKEAIAELQQVLAIDPEDLQAHYNLMLAHQGLADDAGASRHEALYRRFKADEAAQTITGPFRKLHPHDNNERQAVHEHGSALDRGPASSATATAASPATAAATATAAAPTTATAPAPPPAGTGSYGGRR